MASVEYLLNLDPNSVQRMNEKQLRQAVQTLSSAANKRLTRLEQTAIGKVSPALLSVKESGRDRFSTKGKNLNQLRNEFSQASTFLKSKTSTIKGTKSWKRKVENKAGVEMTDAQFSEFGVLFGKLRVAVGREAIRQAGSTEVIRWLRQEMTDSRNRNDDDIINAVIMRMMGLYEEYEEQRAEEWGEFDDFYEFDDDDGDEFPFG